MKLYQNPMSSPCRRTLATIYQLNLPVELQAVQFGEPLMKSPEFLKMNPNGAIPLLQDGDFSLWESLAIMQYLAEKAGSDLYPKELKARAEVNRWNFWSAYHLAPATGTFVWENLLKKMFNMGEPDANALKKSTEDFHKYAKVLDQQLVGRKYITGDTLTLADFTIASNLMYAKESQLPWNDYGYIKAWYERMEDLDSWKKSQAQK